MQFSGEPCTFLFMRLDQPGPDAGKSFLGELSIGDVQARSNVASKRAIRIEPRGTNVENPSILSVMTSQPVLHFEILATFKSLRVGRDTSPQVVGVDRFRPTIPELLLKRSSAEIQPALVEVRAELVRTRHPDHYGCAVGNQPESLFALADHEGGFFMLLGEGGKNHERYRGENQEHL